MAISRMFVDRRSSSRSNAVGKVTDIMMQPCIVYIFKCLLHSDSKFDSLPEHIIISLVVFLTRHVWELIFTIYLYYVITYLLFKLISFFLEYPFIYHMSFLIPLLTSFLLVFDIGSSAFLTAGRTLDV